MAFQQPSTTPSFHTNREQEDSHWRQKKHAVDGQVPSLGQSKVTSGYAFPRSPSGTNSLPYENDTTSTNGSLSATDVLKEKIGEFWGGISERDLPMYKDKPHFPTSRRSSFIRAAFPPGRRRRWVLLGTIFFAVIWWTGLFSSSKAGLNVDEGYVEEQRSWWQWFTRKEVDWNYRRHLVRQAFLTSWNDYAENGWGTDIYGPIRRYGKMMVTPEGEDLPGTAGAGWIIVDALDTAMMMNLTAQVAQARKWIATSLDFSQLNGEISTFETTIRVLGGLLSAHYLSTTFPNLAAQQDDDHGAKGEDLYIEKAVDLADRLLGAFDTKSGIPLASINLNTSQGIQSIDLDGASSTAEAATLQLELKYVAKLTGEPLYWEKAEEVMRVIESNKREAGLLPIYISYKTGEFVGSNIRLGSRGDSYYEYLIKQFLQTGGREIVYSDMWEEALRGIKEHMISFSKHGNFTVLAELPYGVGQELSGKMDHLVCFLPGTIALGVTGGQTVAEAKKRMGSKWGRKQEEDLVLAEELMKTCYGMYAVTKTGLAPEIAYMVLDDEPRRWKFEDQDPTWQQPRSTVSFENDDHRFEPLSFWKDDYDIHINDVHNLQRPETLESLLYMYRITRNEKYRHWGWEIFRAFEAHTQVYNEKGFVRAYTSIDDVTRLHDRKAARLGAAGHGALAINSVNGIGRDNMEGFWLAETLKYLYLLFSDEKTIPDEWFDLSKVVINTEAHFFPRFDIEGSKVFKTGWSRQKGVPDQANTETVEDAAAKLASELQQHALHITENDLHVPVPEKE